MWLIYILCVVDNYGRLLSSQFYGRVSYEKKMSIKKPNWFLYSPDSIFFHLGRYSLLLMSRVEFDVYFHKERGIQILKSDWICSLLHITSVEGRKVLLSNSTVSRSSRFANPVHLSWFVTFIYYLLIRSTYIPAVI